jgi:hypothetical protein
VVVFVLAQLFKVIVAMVQFFNVPIVQCANVPMGTYIRGEGNVPIVQFGNER